jgi:hypothetical protein
VFVGGVFVGGVVVGDEFVRGEVVEAVILATPSGVAGGCDRNSARS